MIQPPRNTLGSILLTLSVCAAFQVHAQPRAEACFFSADFEGTDPLEGWDLGPAVERQGTNGNGLGEFVAAWTVGNATQANAAGYFPVPDAPIGGHFVMVNDAAPPCNCALGEVGLTTPSLDFSDKAGVGMECRVFNDGQFGGGTAFIESSVGDGPWTLIENIAAVSGNWQQLSFDLSMLDGLSDVHLRFRWSDGNTWASGFAVDDICIRERLANDVSMLSATIGDVNASAFDTGIRTLSYRELPLEQAAPLSVSIALRNRGLNAAPITGLDVNVIQNGISQIQLSQFPIGVLQSGHDTLVRMTLNWTPSEVGNVTLACSVNNGTLDEDLSDNSILTELRITGPGWDGGYSAMSCDANNATGFVGGVEQFIASNRMELTASTSQAVGISAMIGTNSQVGAVVRAMLADANFALIDTSARHTLTQEDIDGLWNGIPVYLPLSSAPTLGPGDVFAGMQHIVGTSTSELYVSVSGDALQGRCALQEGTGFSLSYLASTPMVRLHFSAVAVGLPESPIHDALLSAYPNPATDQVRLEFTLQRSSEMTVELFDPTGRMVRSRLLGTPDQGHNSILLSVADLPAGVYTARIFNDSMRENIRIEVAH